MDTEKKKQWEQGDKLEERAFGMDSDAGVYCGSGGCI